MIYMEIPIAQPISAEGALATLANSQIINIFLGVNAIRAPPQRLACAIALPRGVWIFCSVLHLAEADTLRVAGNSATPVWILLTNLPGLVCLAHARLSAVSRPQCVGRLASKWLAALGANLVYPGAKLKRSFGRHLSADAPA